MRVYYSFDMATDDFDCSWIDEEPKKGSLRAGQNRERKKFTLLVRWLANESEKCPT